MSTPPGRLGLGVVGAGRVGAVLASALRSSGHAVVGVSATSQESRERAEALLPAVPVLEVQQVVERSELVLLTVPDDVLGELVEGLATLGAFQPGQLVVHTAGRFGVNVLAPARAAGAIPLAIHPAMTFTGTSVDLSRLVGAPFAVTADAPVLPIAQALVVEIGGEPIPLAESSRGLYHAALAHGGNHLVTLTTQASRVLAAAGVEDGGTLLRPLLTAALDGALRGGEVGLTGPVVRGDAGTVGEHLEVLSTAAAADPGLSDVVAGYRTMARGTVQRALSNQRIGEAQAAALLDALSNGQEPPQGHEPAPEPAAGAPEPAPGAPEPAPGAPGETTALDPPGEAAEATTQTPVAATIAELRHIRGGWQGTTAVVMTMGALHEGHLNLVRRARELADHVLVTLFVNPLQFGPGEDLDRYPRDLAADLETLRGQGVDLVFAPSQEEMYPDGVPRVWVRSGRMGEVLEGAARPGHFDGVLTVVNKLLHLTGPDIAVFGQKDAQQLALVRRMVADQNLPVHIEAVPIAREDDGLASSSRNVYLTRQQRRIAPALGRAVRAGAEAAAAGQKAGQVRRAAQQVLSDAAAEVGDEERDEAGDGDRTEVGNIDAGQSVSGNVNMLTIDYLELVDEGTMEPVADQLDHGHALLVLAARVGQTRLLDNAIVRWPASSDPQVGDER